MTVVVDANIFISSSLPNDVHNSISVEFLHQLAVKQVRMLCPTLALIEVSGAIARITGNSGMAVIARQAVETFPGLTLVDLDVAATSVASALAANQFIRGADAVYAGTASMHSCELVTLDNELQARTKGEILVSTPAEWIQNNVVPPPSAR
jgi:predicted nucleic acid-binding protein